MNPETPRSNTYLNVETVRSPDASEVQLAMTLADFDYINETCINTEEMTLFEFAEVDTRRAYKICKSALNTLLSKDISAVKHNKELVIDVTTATPKEVGDTGRSFTSILPDEDFETIDLSINIHPSKDDIRIFEIDPDTQYALFQMHIDPPNLAA